MLATTAPASPTVSESVVIAPTCTVPPILTTAMPAQTRPTASHQVRRPGTRTAPATAATAATANSAAT